MHKANTKYDIVIVGSGLGGLTSGAILAKQGFKVCVLEKHNQIGGNLQVFKRNGCSFSAGMHYGGALDKGQTLYKVFTYLGIYKDLKLTRLDEDKFERIIIEDKEYTYAMGMENFKNNLIQYFPDEKTAIENYADKLDEIWESSDYINLRELTPGETKIFKDYEENAFDYIQSLTKNETLRAVLSATNGLYIGNKFKTPLYTHATINNFYIKSAWRLAEDGATIAKLLEKVIVDNAGEVIVKKEVKQLKFDGDKIVSAKLIDGKEVLADTFISNIHPTRTFDLLETGKLRKVYVNRINKLENSISTFMQFIVLKKKQVKHINSNIYYSTSEKIWDNYEYEPEDWPKGYMMYTTEDSENKGFAESVVVLSMMKMEDVKVWEDTKIMKRGEDYLKFKSEKSEKLLNLVKLKFPDIIEGIDKVYTATPLTFRDYTGSVDGSMYGIVKDCNNPLGTLLSPKTRVPNLYLTGQNVGLHGLLGVVMTSIQTCSFLVDINKVLKEMRRI